MALKHDESSEPMSSAQWLDYFHDNALNLLELPWDAGAQITAGEREAIAASVQEFQLGESSEGRNLISAARRYAEQSGDAAYLHGLLLFIAEEHRHARDLGRFLDLAGVPRAGHAWPDTVFRWMRRGAGLEASIVVLVTAEVIAKVYYAALRDATGSRLLRRLCDQILRDEVAHVHFQTERLAILRAGRSGWRMGLSSSLHRFLMFGTIFVVWHKHGRALKQGGYSFGRFWRDTWKETHAALRRAEPAGVGSSAAVDLPVPAVEPAVLAR
jgi:hypothetical protein